MYGMGEAHLDVQIERMKRKFGVEVDDGARQDRVPRDDPRARARASAAT